MSHELWIILGWIFSLSLFITTICVVGVIISENRNPVRSLAWITVLLVVPVFGLILYFIFGRDIKNKRAALSRKLRRKLRKSEKAVKPDYSRLTVTEQSQQLIRVGHLLTGAGLHFNNSAEVFTSGKEKMDSLIADIKKAKKYILFQYYIIENDDLGKQFHRLLIEKANEGVKVCVIFDPVGCVSTGKRFFRELEENGVVVKSFIPVRFPSFGTKINWRNHRKQCVIDGETAYIGGMNIAQRYVDGGKEFDSWRDLHLRLTGRIVTAVETSFITDWSFMGDDYENLPTLEFTPATHNHNLTMQLLTSGPTSQWYNIEMLYLKAIGAARKKVYIETPYFLPTAGLVNALQSAALAGVDVRVLVPRRSDSVILTLATSSYVEECLKAGIKIYFYTPGMLHSKMLIIDDEITSIGSTNFDFRSFEHNFELTLFTYSKEFNLKMTDIFREGLEKSLRIIPAQWNNRSRWRRTKESVMRLLAPIL